MDKLASSRLHRDVTTNKVVIKPWLEDGEWSSRRIDSCVQLLAGHSSQIFISVERVVQLVRFKIASYTLLMSFEIHLLIIGDGITALYNRTTKELVVLTIICRQVISPRTQHQHFLQNLSPIADRLQRINLVSGIVASIFTTW